VAASLVVWPTTEEVIMSRPREWKRPLEWDLVGEVGLDQLARTIVGEARGEDWAGQVAVAWTVVNRVRAAHGDGPRWWGTDVAGVVHADAQFSCWFDAQASRLKALSIHSVPYRVAMEAALAVLNGHEPDPTGGATHYHVTAMPTPPVWAAKLRPTVSIGAHSFYVEEA